MFPAVEGKALADTLTVKGAEEFLEGMRSPPENSLEVFFPSESGRGGKLGFSNIPDEIYLEESGGYLGVRLWIEDMGDVGAAGDIAASWTRDGYVLFADGESSSGLVWDVEFESEEAAEQFQNVALDRLGAMAEMDRRATANEVMESGERFLRVVRFDRRSVRFINAATRKTAMMEFQRR